MYSLLVSLHSLIKYFKDPFCLSYFRHMFTLPTYNARRANKFNHNIHVHFIVILWENVYYHYNTFKYNSWSTVIISRSFWDRHNHKVKLCLVIFVSHLTLHTALCNGDIQSPATLHQCIVRSVTRPR